MIEDTPPTNDPTPEPVDLALIRARAAYGICSAPDCDQPIACWCTRCAAKMCSHHARIVQLAPDYRAVVRCYRCEPASNIVEDPATILIHRPAYDPDESSLSEGHAAWWLACCLHRYIKLLASQAPGMLLDRELDLIASRLDGLGSARSRSAPQTERSEKAEGGLKAARQEAGRREREARK